MRTIAGAVVLLLAAAGSSSMGGAENAERVALARAEAALVAAGVPDTRCPEPRTRGTSTTGGCAADEATGEHATEPSEQRAAPAAKPATGVCARNPETGRRKCSVRYLA
jgi:hypothetical protein